MVMQSKIVVPGLHAGTHCAVLHGSLCVYVCIVLIYSAAKLQVCFSKLTLLTLFCQMIIRRKIVIVTQNDTLHMWKLEIFQ